MELSKKRHPTKTWFINVYHHFPSFSHEQNDHKIGHHLFCDRILSPWSTQTSLLWSWASLCLGRWGSMTPQLKLHCWDLSELGLQHGSTPTMLSPNHARRGLRYAIPWWRSIPNHPRRPSWRFPSLASCSSGSRSPWNIRPPPAEVLPRIWDIPLAKPNLKKKTFEILKHQEPPSRRFFSFTNKKTVVLGGKKCPTKSTIPPQRPKANRAMGRSLCRLPGRRDDSCSYPPVAGKNTAATREMLTNSRDVDLQKVVDFDYD